MPQAGDGPELAIWGGSTLRVLWGAAVSAADSALPTATSALAAAFSTAALAVQLDLPVKIQRSFVGMVSRLSFGAFHTTSRNHSRAGTSKANSQIRMQPKGGFGLTKSCSRDLGGSHSQSILFVFLNNVVDGTTLCLFVVSGRDNDSRGYGGFV